MSRFPGFVERRGKVAFRGRNLFPRGDTEFPRAVRQAQAISSTALVILVVAMAASPLTILAAARSSNEGYLTWLFVVAAAVLVLALVALVPSIKAMRAGQRVRDAHARGEFWQKLAPDGTPMSRPDFQATPGWE